MVRTQMYLPDPDYKYVKKTAQKKGMSFAGYVRVLIERDKLAKKKKMTIQEKYPFIGMFNGGKNDSDNESIDEFLVNQHGN